MSDMGYLRESNRDLRSAVINLKNSIIAINPDLKELVSCLTEAQLESRNDTNLREIKNILESIKSCLLKKDKSGDINLLLAKLITLTKEQRKTNELLVSVLEVLTDIKSQNKQSPIGGELRPKLVLIPNTSYQNLYERYY